jgi:hypothetical protein
MPKKEKEKKVVVQKSAAFPNSKPDPGGEKHERTSVSNSNSLTNQLVIHLIFGKTIKN